MIQKESWKKLKTLNFVQGWNVIPETFHDDGWLFKPSCKRNIINNEDIISNKVVLYFIFLDFLTHEVRELSWVAHFDVYNKLMSICTYHLFY